MFPVNKSLSEGHSPAIQQGSFLGLQLM